MLLPTSHAASQASGLPVGLTRGPDIFLLWSPLFCLPLSLCLMQATLAISLAIAVSESRPLLVSTVSPLTPQNRQLVNMGALAAGFGLGAWGLAAPQE